MAGPNRAEAQAKTCCNTATGDWVSAASEDACAAMPGHVPLTAETTMQVMPCHRKAQEAAASAMQGLLEQVAAAGEAPDCCSAVAGTWVGAMAPPACLALEGHFPDTPEYLADTQACRSGGGGGAWHVDDYEDNIPNGGMEAWEGENTPAGFASFGIPESAKAAAQGFDMQTVFRSTDAHTGQYSARLKNFDLAAALRKLGAPVLAHMAKMSVPAGITSCEVPCPLETGMAAGSASVAQTTLPIEEARSHVCAAYKGFIAPTDQLSFVFALAAGGEIVGGTDSGAAGQSNFTESSSDWRTISLPITAASGALASADGITVSAQVQPRNMLRSIQASGMPGNVSPNTEVIVDSIHFCGLDMLTIYEPRVIGISGDNAIPDEDEETLGAQTFVNFDNDDQDQFFDHEDTDGVENDDELVRIKMNLPMDSRGKVQLMASDLGKKLALWDDENKTRKFEQANQLLEVEEVLRATPDGSKLERQVWVEALRPSSGPNDMVLEFIFQNRLQGDAETSDKVSLTALGIETIRFRGKGNGIGDDDVLDRDPNAPKWLKDENYRVFPGKRFDGDKPEAQPRDIVDVEVELNVKPVRPVELVFRALDVDDPSAWNDEVDRENRASDNRGETPNFWGGFPADPKQYLKVEFSEEKETFEFQVTMQPGDNFRIVGGGDVVTLMRLENDDAKLTANDLKYGVKIVDPGVLDAENDPGKAMIPEHGRYVSNILTVWRKLYLEIDSMGPVKDNEVTAEIVGLRDGGLYEEKDANGVVIETRRQQWVEIDKNLFASLPKESQSEPKGLENNYAWGRMTIGGTGGARFDTNGNTANASGNDEIRLVHEAGSGVLSNNAEGMAVTLVDDDAWKNGDSLPDLPTGRLAPAFAPAYVLPVEGAAPNDTKVIPFQLHFKSDEQSYLKSVFRKGFDNWVYHDEEDIWIVYLLNAFQGKLNEDGDGDGGLSGQADGDEHTGLNGFGAVVFQESARETALAYAANSSDGLGTGWQLPDVAPHEIGHLFGALHGDGGLMSYDEVKTTEFEPVSLDRIRSRLHP